jgi:hypothetical protein
MWCNTVDSSFRHGQNLQIWVGREEVIMCKGWFGYCVILE